MKVRKKPIIVEAIQFDPLNKHRLKLPDGVYCINSPGADNYGYEGNKFYIDTLEGRHEVTVYDWIITGVKGEKYPCKPDIFELTYDKIEDDL